MKNKTLSFIVAAGLVSTAGFSDETASCKAHQIYFGPEFLNISVHTKIKTIQVKGREHFSGVRFGYEYLKPWACYAGVDLLSSRTSHQFSASDEQQPLQSNDHGTGFGNLDFRFGYTVASKHVFVTPFLGIGSFALGMIHDNGLHEVWAYASIGIRCKFLINSVFSLGLNVKGFKSFFSYEQFKNHEINETIYPTPWGGEIGIPCMWNFNPKGTWTFQLEPYWLRLNFSESQEVFGSKFLIGTHF